MSILSNTLLAFSMSADAFAAAVSKGTSITKPQLSYALRVGAVFGAVETFTPLVGWLIGKAASGFIQEIDHWVAFTILAGIGCKMMYESLQKDRPEKPDRHGLKVLLLTAFGTSIDAMAVGAGLALLEVNIIMMALMIGMATFTMATIGIMAGHYLGMRAGRIAEALGGLCLIGIGSAILMEHLSGLA